MSARTIVVLIVGLALPAGGMLPGAAWGQDDPRRPLAGFDSKPIGQVQNVTGSVTIEHTSGVLVQANVPTSGRAQTKVDDPIYLNDVIQTGADGTVGLIFGDGTSFIASSNARMEINEFIYDPKGSSNSTLFNLTKGTFTFLAGKAAKTGNMKVETPVGTMGIRGTAPHVEILDDGTVNFTTLIEESKNVEPKPAPAPRRERRAGDRDWNRILVICRSC
jgi:hypothetical protein